MAKKIILAAIKAYQKTLSLDHGIYKRRYPTGFCKFRPTCSEYTYQAVEELGVFKGLWLGVVRVVRCNPWSKGGFDPVFKDRRF